MKEYLETRAIDTEADAESIIASLKSAEMLWMTRLGKKSIKGIDLNEGQKNLGILFRFADENQMVLGYEGVIRKIETYIRWIKRGISHPGKKKELLGIMSAYKENRYIQNRESYGWPSEAEHPSENI